MGYVAIKGGEDAIANAGILVDFFRLRNRQTPIEIEQIRTQFRLLIDKIMGEGSLYAPEHASIALKQVAGDMFEAAFILRAFRATLKRNYSSDIIDTRNASIERRVSSAFKEIPGGQILGPSRDYSHRILNHDEEEPIDEVLKDLEAVSHTIPDHTDAGSGESLPKIVDILHREGVLKPVLGKEDTKVVDITREAIKFPAPRSARLQMLARSETGGLVSLAYSALRGFGSPHTTVGELRVMKASIVVSDARGRKRSIGRIRLTEADMISRIHTRGKDPVPYLSAGYGLCFGQNEAKAISMGILDRTMREEEDFPAQSQEFVLYHTEGVESFGFTNHLKLPHYVTFQSGLNNLRQAMERKEKKREAYTVGSIRNELPTKPSTL